MGLIKKKRRRKNLCQEPKHHRQTYDGKSCTLFTSPLHCGAQPDHTALTDTHRRRPDVGAPPHNSITVTEIPDSFGAFVQRPSHQEMRGGEENLKWQRLGDLKLLIGGAQKMTGSF